MSLAYTPVSIILEDIERKKLDAEVEKQFKEEYGDEELPAHKQNHRSTPSGSRLFDHGCDGCHAQEEISTLRQKYGLVPVALTEKERKVINRDEKRRNADAFMRGQ